MNYKTLSAKKRKLIDYLKTINCKKSGNVKSSMKNEDEI